MFGFDLPVLFTGNSDNVMVCLGKEMPSSCLDLLHAKHRPV